jgi:hypothetical protein
MATRERSTRLTREQAEWFRARWAPVNEVEREELRATSIDVKLHQLAGLMASARALGWMQPDRVDDEETRDRWQRLRRGYGVEH